MPDNNIDELFEAVGKNDVEKVKELIARGVDVNAREKGDNTYPMHWAAAAGSIEIVRLLADAGGDVIGSGDDHELEVIGWATCWYGCDDDAHRAVADFLLSRGARHHIFSAIAIDSADEVRRIVASDPSAINKRMSRNENHQTPLQFAVRMNRPDMVALLMQLGADPLAVDGDGQTAPAYATSKNVDRPVMEAIHRMTKAELVSAERGNRPSRSGVLDLIAALSLSDWDTASRLVHDNAELLARGGALHLLAKRNDPLAVKWMLDSGADPSALWSHWGADVTPLHLAALSGSTDVARLLLKAGADATIRDSQHNSDALGWAEFFGNLELRQVLAGAKD